MKKYFCLECPNKTSDKALSMCHYDDEVIYEKHLKPETIIIEKEESVK